MNQPGASVVKKTETKQAEISAVVIRCGCGDPDSHNGVRGEARPCPRPRRTDDLGVISYYHTNPLRRLWWWTAGQRLASRRISRSNRS